MDEKAFIDELREKTKALGGPIIDVIHNPHAYYAVESLVNFIIDYFIEEHKTKEAGAP